MKQSPDCLNYTTEIPVRDGKSLKAYVCRPNVKGFFPAIFIYTSYGAKRYMDQIQLVSPGDPMFGLERDSHSLTFASMSEVRNENNFDAYPARRAVIGTDGASVIDWIVSQPWSNRKVGMWGSSSDGINQFITAF